MRGILIGKISGGLIEASWHPGIYIFVGSLLIILFILAIVVSKKRK